MNANNSISHLSENSPSVQAHLANIQSVIQRMAGNSTSCKSWCITIVSAVLVIIAEKDKPNYVFLSLVPTVLFLALDAYYLALEKAFRLTYNDFIKKLHSGKARTEDLYEVSPRGSEFRHQIKALFSFSVWGFYGFQIILVVVAYIYVLK